MATVIACLLPERLLPSSVWIQKLSRDGRHLDESAVSVPLVDTGATGKLRSEPCSASMVSRPHHRCLSRSSDLTGSRRP
jgi:hypothetical protein